MDAGCCAAILNTSFFLMGSAKEEWKRQYTKILLQTRKNILEQVNSKF